MGEIIQLFKAERDSDVDDELERERTRLLLTLPDLEGKATRAPYSPDIADAVDEIESRASEQDWGGLSRSHEDMSMNVASAAVFFTSVSERRSSWNISGERLA
jgi:hypothetical protein